MMSNWLQNVWGKAGELFGKVSEAVDEAVDEAQEEKDSREREAEKSLKRVTARQKQEVEEKLKSRRAERRIRTLEGRGVYSRENLRELAEPEAAEGQEDRPPDFDEWREAAADQSLREVGRRQGQPQVGEPAREPDGERRAAGGDRTNEEIKETLDAIREILEDSKNILMEIREKEPGGATYGP